jgi:ABC-type multidrug transport system ATPase subunit
MAIRISGLKRGYGKISVLESLEMNVDEGSIYGLLGPSGCGKTTLLNVILGFLIPEKGEINVLDNNAQIPGSDVGYAPQELALYFDLNITETLMFHGRLHAMSKSKIEERGEWLKSFLDLPDFSRIVGKLSGGEKRRVSLAVALLHEPRLLLLDEPTVGVDPELRARIWQHLRSITVDGTTVILTTHYIDEAGKADRVGLMRNGRLLAEKSPIELMDEYDTNSLEDVFLTLCKREVIA